jgi:ankyrin repeat protein
LFQREANFRSVDLNGYSTLMHAAAMNHITSVKMLLAAGAFHFCEIIYLSTIAGADANQHCGGRGITPLMLACGEGLDTIVDAMLQYVSCCQSSCLI